MFEGKEKANEVAAAGYQQKAEDYERKEATAHVEIREDMKPSV